jgi:heterodisulfide reductase subunit C
MTCGVRCPNEVDMSEVMDTLREMSREAGLSYDAEKRVVMLHEEFVGSIRRWGRLHEVTFFVTYILRSLDLFSNIPSGLTLFAKRKLPILPRMIKGVKGYRRIFDNVYDTGVPLEEIKDE